MSCLRAVVVGAGMMAWLVVWVWWTMLIERLARQDSTLTLLESLGVVTLSLAVASPFAIVAWTSANKR